MLSLSYTAVCRSRWWWSGSARSSIGCWDGACFDCCSGQRFLLLRLRLWFLRQLPFLRYRRRAGSGSRSFSTENHNFVSSVVIGGAGLMATSLYQCNQTQMARQQAESQQRIAREQADNNWRIERAKILSQNLQTLTARGGDNVEQRYGVLLSLTRWGAPESPMSRCPTRWS